MPLQVTVVGAGVVGLSCAVRLLSAGHRVTVVAAAPPAETTSAVAAAVWHPYLAYPPERVSSWGARTYDVLTALVREHPEQAREAGVRLLPGRELFAAATPDPDWAAAVPDLRRLQVAERGRHADGWGFTSPVVDMPRYLDWLLATVRAGGGRLELRRVTDLAAEATRCNVVVNCTGLAARELVPDSELVPIRGQVVRVRNPGVTEWALDESDPAALTYVIPRIDTVVCGGTAERGAEDLTVDADLAHAILARARALVPALADAPVVSHRVGLRPGRPTVRLERTDGPAGAVVHCYGHGGAGVTLSWGCAEEVVALVSRSEA